ncbi:MAG: valine--tRNA ligase, partial [Chloroflexota bacterium]
AVHPEDDRYKKFIGQTVMVPILNREIPIIADEYVDREFGTGALKITPGHDLNDYEIGQRHDLPIISILNREAQVNENGGKYAGMDRFDARKKLWSDMQAANLTIKVDDYTLNVPRSQRGGEIIEPMISTQWFVEIKSLADAALKSVQDGRIKIVPEHYNKVYFNWLENIRDWCISRQLSWGHRIPVWHCDDCGEMTDVRQDPTECSHCSSKNIHQDPDVLDTWFSSGLWPFSTLGWPEETPDFKYFYPTSILETGYDILFFWVARMIMMGLEFTDEAPFHTIYLHGIVRDGQGRKMSKTLGNDVDPLEIMDELGTDALRFTMLVGSTPGKDTNLSLDKVRSNRNFANKLWNATRLVLSLLEKSPEPSNHKPEHTLADQWILARLNSLESDVERLFQSYQYGEAGRQIYEFFWSELADWYLEIAKLQVAEGDQRAAHTSEILITVLDDCLRLLHPFTPFVTEELWSHLKSAVLAYSPELAPAEDWPDALIIAPWPQAESTNSADETAVTNFNLIMEMIRSIRNLRSEKGVKPGIKLSAIISCGDQAALLTNQLDTLSTLAKLDSQHTTVVDSLDEKPDGHISLVVGSIEIYLPLSEIIDPEEERNRLEKDLSEIQSQITRLETLLSSDFAKKAPDAVVLKEREKLAAYQKTEQRLSSQLKSII